MSKNLVDSNVDWIGYIPDNWNLSKIKYKIDNIISGGTPKSSNEGYYSENGIPFVTIADITKSEEIKITNKYITEEGRQSKRLNIIPEGTILYSIYASVGKVAVANIPLTINQAILGLVFNSSVNKRYMKYTLNALEDYVNYYSSSNTQNNINQEKVRNLILLDPQMYEQEAIANFLDDKTAKIDELIKIQEDSITKLEEFKQSVITEAVTKGLNPNVEMKNSGVEWIGNMPKNWELFKLKHIINKKLQYGANESGIEYHSDLPRYIRITDILPNNQLKEENKLSLSIETANDYILSDGDILFARSGATVGKTFIYNLDYGLSAFAGYLIKASVNEKAYSKFIYYYTLSNSYNEWKNQIFIQATIQNIGADKYANLVIPLPDLDIQLEISKYLDEKIQNINTLIKMKNNKIIKLNEYKKSLIYEAITGKLEVI